MRTRLFFVLASVLVSVGGCTGIQSALYDEGIVYHLPRTLLTLTVVKYRDTENKRTWYQIGAKPKAGTSNNGPELPELGEIESVSIPDPGHRYVAQYKPSAFSDDRLCISRSPTGLLQDVNFASDDRTPEVVFNIARFIAGSLGGERKTGISSSGDVGRLQWEMHTGRVDPLDPESVRKFEESMSERFGEYLTLDLKEMHRIFTTHTAKLPNGCRFGENCPPEAWTDRCTKDNICYRTQLEVPIGLRRNGRHVDTNYAKVINRWDIGAISISRAFLVHKISKFRFDRGVLIGAVIRKPSEVEEVSLLPLHVIYAALHTPSAAVATAFSTNDAAKIKVAEDLATLTEKVNQNTARVKELQQGLSPNVGFKDDQLYELTCSAPGPSGTLINIVTGANK